MWIKPSFNSKNEINNKNVKIFCLKTKTIIAEWVQRNQNAWEPQFTSDEIFFSMNINNNEIRFYKTELDSDKQLIDINVPIYKFKVKTPGVYFENFSVSPNPKYKLAVFIPEISGQPANISIYDFGKFTTPVSHKTFYKAERCQLKWNNNGTELLCLASVDHDSTNKSYYGETNLYLLNSMDSFTTKVELEKDGPIHDFSWSPSSKDFAVVYGFIPSQTTLFDVKGEILHNIGIAPKNTVLYSPHSRFILVAGFGNLQGTIDIFDRQNKLNKVVTIEAPNTSLCKWSPCGRFIMTATTSPRLRVDNGFKIWFYDGTLIYLKEYSTLCDVGWRPHSISDFPFLKQKFELPPEPHPSVLKNIVIQSQKKNLTAYKPPHTRTNNPSNFVIGSKDYSNSFSLIHGKEQGSNLNNNDHIIADSINLCEDLKNSVDLNSINLERQQESKCAAKNRKKREAKRITKINNNDKSKETTVNDLTTLLDKLNDSYTTLNNLPNTSTDPISSVNEKKIRSLLKKLRSIEVLKMKQACGEYLENTQFNKIMKENEIKSELILLGWNN